KIVDQVGAAARNGVTYNHPGSLILANGLADLTRGVIQIQKVLPHMLIPTIVVARDTIDITNEEWRLGE
ncbi:hypothetical protein Gotri_007587, partial [Gossypium trilobum]|nr:hypothetical protein [Gossypium trilobum]